MAKQKKHPTGTIALNKKALHDYFIEHKFEAGLVLSGWEVKSLRAGKAQLVDSYVLLKDDEAWLMGCHISPLTTASTHVIADPTRTRKLLLNKLEGTEIAELLAARQAGKINAGTSITGGGDLLRQNGTPKTKVSASLTWRYKQLTVGGFTQYIGDYNDTALLDSAGSPWVVDSQITANLYGEYDFAQAQTKLRLGVRNLTDESFIAQRTTGSFIGIQPGEIRNFYGGVSWRF